MATYDQYGNQLDELKKRAAGLVAPGSAQEKLKPGSRAAYQSQKADYAQQIGDLQTKYEGSLGNVGPATGRAMGIGGMTMNVPPVPALNTAQAAPVPAVPARGIAAPPPMAGPTTSQMPQAPVTASTPQVAAPQVATPQAAPAIDSPNSTVPYQPITRTVGPDGKVTITGSGQSPAYLQAQGGINQMPALQIPQQTRQGPLPTLDMTTPNQNIFQALGKLGGEMGKYRDTAIANRQNQTDFKNTLEAGRFGIDQARGATDTARGQQDMRKGEQDIAKGAMSLADQQRLTKLRDDYLKLNDANDKDGKKRAEIQRQANVLAGKDTHDKYVPLMAKDEMGNPVFMGAFDTRTGERVQTQQQQQQGTPGKISRKDPRYTEAMKDPRVGGDKAKLEALLQKNGLRIVD